MIYIGIDVHKKKCVACLKNEKGRVITELEFENKTSGFSKLLEKVEGKEAKAVMESTGNLWIRLYTALETAGVEVMLSNPSKTRVIAESKMQTDKVSARTLAELLRTGFIAACYVPPAEVRALRHLIRYRTKLVRDLTRIKNRIHSILDKYELPTCECTDQFGKGGLQWLRMILPLLDVEDQFIMGSELDRIVYHQSRIEDVSLRIAAKTVETEDSLKADGTPSEPAIAEDVVTLLTLIGVDYFTAMLFLYEIGDVTRFSSASKLTSWLGLVPSVHQSGNTCYHGKITKKGSRLVRWALIQSAQVAVQKDPHWREKFNRISYRRGKQKAYVAIARELAVTMYHMLMNDEPYRYQREETTNRKLKKLNRLIKKAQTNQGEAPVQCFSS
ncbi:MAG: IS110 family transposase [Theionarchaea archaeon]|nr:IS110 family transposase [Theionarchaea archaeon]